MCFSRIAAALCASLLAGCAAWAPAPAASVSGAARADEPAPNAKGRNTGREREHREHAAMSAAYFLKLESDENGPPTAAQLSRALRQRQDVQAFEPKRAGIQPYQWQALGPSSVGGRVRALAFDPRNPNRVLAGTASGGLWSSNDLGASWQVDNDFLANLSITTVAFDPFNAGTVYLGTGEASAGLVGFGAYKSTDNGATWALMPATNVDANPDWRFVNRIAASPAQPGLLLAGVTNSLRNGGGIYRSTDGGASWGRMSAYKALDIAFDPANPMNALAGLDDGGLAYSSDGGITWVHTAQLVTPGPSNSTRAEIAFARSQPGRVFASIDNAKGEVWRSDDSGATWTRLANPKHLNTQGEYDNAIWVDPTDANNLLVAGLDIYQSRDGGTTFTQVSDWKLAPQSAHADHHALVSPPDYSATHRVVLNGNDGGVYRADDVFRVDTGSGWTAANNGLAVTQFYSGAGSASGGGRIVGGTQDNGALMYTGGAWTRYRGGDGGFAAVDPRNDRTIYGEYVYLAIHRSLTGGASSAYVCSGITEAMPDDKDAGNTYCGAGNTQAANFIAPFILDPNNPDRLLAGANSLWVSDNAAAPQPAWHAIKSPSAAPSNYINAIAVAPGNSAIVWVGHNNGEVYRTANGTVASPAWTRVGAGVLPGRLVQRITIDQDDPSRVIVAFTGFSPDDVWETTDNGASWHSITGNLPQAPVFDVKRHPQRANWLYAATSVGLFTSEDRGATWSTTNEGPANIRIRELFWIDANTLGAATYGRGMFKIAVNPAMANYQDLWWGGEAESGWGLALAHHGGTLFGALYVYDASGKPTWLAMAGGTWDASFTTFTGTLFSPTGSYWAAYDASRYAAGPSVGQATIRFTGTSTAVLDYTVNGASGTKTLSRYVFGPPDSTPIASFGDLWWGGASQNGWGLTIVQQYRTMFIAWYTYDAQGHPTWFVVPGGTWTSASRFTARAYRASGVPWAGVAFNAAGVALADVGSVTLDFQDASHATFTTTIDGTTVSRPVERFLF